MSALLIHGAGGGAWEWNVWRGVLSTQGIEVHAIELQPVAGGLAATTMDDYLQQVCTVLQGLPPPKVVIGASLGGLLALQVADQTDALVLINPLPPAPWHSRLPGRDWNDIVPWQRGARLSGTRAALPDADDAAALFAFRRWRDESGAVMREACAGVEVARPACPTLLVASSDDGDVAPGISRDIAQQWDATVLEAVAASHVGPLLGRQAPELARQAVAWLNRIRSLLAGSDLVDPCPPYDAAAPIGRLEPSP